jgi:hypothetical protein
MNINPKANFWTDLVKYMHLELGQAKADELFRSGKIFLKDMGETTITFICPTGKDRKLFTRDYSYVLSKVISKINPSIKKIEITATRNKKPISIQLEAYSHHNSACPAYH